MRGEVGKIKDETEGKGVGGKLLTSVQAAEKGENPRKVYEEKGKNLGDMIEVRGG